jgi:hypothetical protein
VGGRVVIGRLVALVAPVVGVHQRRVIVLVLVVMGPMLELAEQVARVVMGHVVVDVGVHHGLVRMLVLGIAHHALHDRTLLHEGTSLVFCLQVPP